jgi:putative RNA 2'-phosphotransferase
MNPERRVRISKLLAMGLRHRPGELGLTLDSQGWALVADVLAGFAARGKPITMAELEEVVALNDKQRYAFDEAHEHIRANQGHSIDVDLQLEERQPPEVLYHGTADRNLNAIMQSGLLKMQRHHVHLSVDPMTARTVGQRHGRPVVLVIRAREMVTDGHCFYISENQVWLTEHVPATYLEIYAEP